MEKFPLTLLKTLTGCRASTFLYISHLESEGGGGAFSGSRGHKFINLNKLGRDSLDNTTYIISGL